MDSSKNSLVIMKFGGSCLLNRESYLQITNIVKEYMKSTRVLIVVSAIKGMTNKLINFYEKSCSEEKDCDLIIEDIYNDHFQLIKKLFDEDSSEYGDTLEILQKNFEDLKHLGSLIKLIRPSADIYDLFVSYGERLSTIILSNYLSFKGYNS